jgi:hypothetical protein
MITEDGFEIGTMDSIDSQVKAELKAEHERILANLRENPSSIIIEKSEYLYHPSDYHDTRVGIAFFGDLAFLAGLFTEFWSQSSVKPFVFTNLDQHSQSEMVQHTVTYEQNLQKNELEDYRSKMESSPLNSTLTDDEIDEKIAKMLESGDKTRLFVNSKQLSSNSFDKVNYTVPVDNTDIILKLAAADPESRIKLIVFVNSATSQKNETKIEFSHPSIPHLSPKLETPGSIGLSETELDEFSTFVRNLPDVLQLFI